MPTQLEFNCKCCGVPCCPNNLPGTLYLGGKSPFVPQTPFTEWADPGSIPLGFIGKVFPPYWLQAAVRVHGIWMSACYTGRITDPDAPGDFGVQFALVCAQGDSLNDPPFWQLYCRGTLNAAEDLGVGPGGFALGGTCDPFDQDFESTVAFCPVTAPGCFTICGVLSSDPGNPCGDGITAGFVVGRWEDGAEVTE